MLDIIREETDAFLEVNRKTPLHHMTVLRRIAVRDIVPKPYSAEFLRTCNLTQSQMQKIIEALISDDRIYRDDTGIHIVDPLEGLADHSPLLSFHISFRLPHSGFRIQYSVFCHLSSVF